MDDISQSYSNLKEIISRGSSNGTVDINPLKDLFSSIINSNRTNSQINDFVSLITVLEKRDALGPENIDCLEVIFNALNLSSKALNEHKSLVKQRAASFHGSLIDNNQTDQMPYHLSQASSTIQTENGRSFQGKLPEEVVSAVASQIGYSWKGLARYLGHVKEGTLEKIEEDPSITTNEMRARLMLAEYERNVKPSEVVTRLLKALDLSRRKDLHDQVLNIIL